MLGLIPADGGSLKPGPINEIPNLVGCNIGQIYYNTIEKIRRFPSLTYSVLYQVVSSSLKTEIPVLSAMLSRLFESSRYGNR